MKTLKVILLGLASIGLMASCNSGESSGSAAGGGDNPVGSNQVSLLKAKSQDVSDSVVEVEEVVIKESHGKKGCNGKNKNDKKEKKEKHVKVAICHLPPGNPDNAHTLVLPLKAVLAHLKHGGPHHKHHDFMGPCEGDSEDDMDEVDPEDPTYGNDDGSDEGSDDAGNGDYTGNDDAGAGDDSGNGDGMGTGGDDVGIGSGDPVYEDPVPQYCTDNMAADPDCDGVNDQSGDLMY